MGWADACVVMRWNLEPPWAATPYQAISDQTIPNINNSFNVVLYQKLPNHTETYNAITTRQWSIVASTASKKKNNCKLGLCGMDPQHSLPGIKKQGQPIYIYTSIYTGAERLHIFQYIFRRADNKKHNHDTIILSTCLPCIVQSLLFHQSTLFTFSPSLAANPLNQASARENSSRQYCSRAMRATENTYESVGEQ